MAKKKTEEETEYTPVEIVDVEERIEQEEELEDDAEVEDTVFTEYTKPSERQSNKRDPFVPVNDSQAVFAMITPTYSDLPPETLKTSFGIFLENWQSGHRLANLTETEAKLNNYDFVTASEANDIGLQKVSASLFADITARCEISQGRKGFRTRYLNYLKQDISDGRQSKKRSIMGNKTEES